jgi:hypothetical protein
MDVTKCNSGHLWKEGLWLLFKTVLSKNYFSHQSFEMKWKFRKITELFWPPQSWCECTEARVTPEVKPAWCEHSCT